LKKTGKSLRREPSGRKTETIVTIIVMILIRIRINHGGHRTIRIMKKRIARKGICLSKRQVPFCCAKFRQWSRCS